MRDIRSICVYCGASPGSRPEYVVAAKAFGAFLAQRRVRVVFGGGRVGLMGAVADGALEAGGEVIGVIPAKLLDLELGHTGCTELRVVQSMHARKAAMSELSDAFVAMPGGWGTLDEICEAATWTQLNDHTKPVGLLDVLGYWKAFVAFLDHASTEGFVRPPHRKMLVVEEDPGRLLEGLASVEIPLLGSWVPRR